MLYAQDILKVAYFDFRFSDVSQAEWTAVPMQGSGTFSVEAVVQTAVPRNTDKKVGCNLK